MKLARNLFLAVLILSVAALPALAQTIVTSPVNGQQVPFTFNLNMVAITCSAQPVTAVGYSFDSSAYTAIFNAQQINGPVNGPAGWHTLHIKVWNGSGGVCVTDLSVDIGVGASSLIPANAVSVGEIQTLGNWVGVQDTGSSGSASGTMSLVSQPSLTGTARLYATQLNSYGGERFSAQFDDDQTAQNFFYDTWFYIANNADGIANLEFDLNQTMQNGETVIMGFQCDSWTQTWDYTVNGGSPDNYSDQWLHSYSPCNLHSWGANQWHHLQIYFSHDGNGWVTYHSVWLDGNEEDLNFDVFSGFNLGWGPGVLTNFQIDGNNPGTSWGNVYLDELTVYHW